MLHVFHIPWARPYLDIVQEEYKQLYQEQEMRLRYQLYNVDMSILDL